MENYSELGNRYKAINDLITSIATDNIFITAEQVAKARALYNGDMRPLEEIKAELLEYSASITADAKARAREERVLEEKINSLKNDEKVNAYLEKTTKNSDLDKYETGLILDGAEAETLEFAQESAPIEYGLLVHEEKHILPESTSTASVPNLGNSNGELGEMLEEYFTDSTPLTQIPIATETEQLQKPKQLIKTAPTNDNNTGFSNVSALLTIATLLSIATLIISLAALIA